MDGSKQLREEFSKTSFRHMLKDIKGCRCVNCGSEEDIEYHHIVPLVMGGTNNLGNIVPLCYECHKKAHGYKEVHKKDWCNTGRPRRELKNLEKALFLFENGEIGTNEFKKITGIPKTRHLTDIPEIKEKWLEQGISSISNTIDILKKRGNEYSKAKVIVKYENGNVETIIK